MSSPPKEDASLKAGHPPAVKAGNMRIVQSKNPAEKVKGGDQKKEDVVFGQEATNKELTSVSGAPVKGNADFPVAAIKSYHEKPIESKSINHNVPNQLTQVHQPRNNNH